MGKWKRVTTALVGTGLAAVVATGLAACGAGSSSKGTIKICSEFPTTQKAASAGKPAENGVALAVDQANRNNTVAGYTLVHVKYDDVGPSGSFDAQVGANNIRDAVGKASIAGCVGPLNSSVAKAEMPIANQAPLAMISPANTNETLTKPQFGATAQYRPTGKVTYFRVCTTDDIQGPAMADYYYDTLKGANGQVVRKVYVLNDLTTYGAGIAKNFVAEFTKKGGTVIANDGQDASVTDFKPELTKVASKNPDAIYYGGNDSTTGIQLRITTAQTPGLEKVPWGGGDGIQTDAFKTGTGASGLGTLVSVASVNADTLPQAAQFKKDFKVKFPNDADYGAYSANGFEAANVMLVAINNAIKAGATPPKDDSDTDTANVFRQKVIDQIAKTDYNGVIGHTTFDANGDTSNRWISFWKLGASDWEYVFQLQFT